METLTEQLQSPQVCEEDPNGSVIVDDLVHVQKVNRELEQQLNDKNKVSYLYATIIFPPNLLRNVTFVRYMCTRG